MDDRFLKIVEYIKKTKPQGKALLTNRHIDMYVELKNILNILKPIVRESIQRAQAEDRLFPSLTIKEVNKRDSVIEYKEAKSILPPEILEKVTETKLKSVTYIKKLPKEMDELKNKLIVKGKKESKIVDKKFGNSLF